MSKRWQIRRGTTSENNAFTGAQGELTMGTEKKQIRVHDGTTQGGVEIPSGNTADYVVEWQLPTAENNYTWYRKYKSGWVEQGGYVEATTSSIASKAVSLPVTMANSNYQVSKTTHMGADTTESSAWGWWSDKISTSSANTTTTVYLSVAHTGFCIGVYWEVKGMAA